MDTDAPSGLSNAVSPTRRRLLATGAAAATGFAGFAGCAGFTGPDVTEASSRTFDAPEGVVSVRNRNGDARAIDVEGYVTVRSSNGDAEARGTTGLAGARSANGDVHVEVYALRGATDVTSANGDVETGVAPDLDATVLATVGNGDPDVEVELDDAGVSARQARGRLGEGGPLLTLTSANGDVRLYELSN